MVIIGTLFIVSGAAVVIGALAGRLFCWLTGTQKLYKDDPLDPDPPA
jgi:hypothetical protein